MKTPGIPANNFLTVTAKTHRFIICGHTNNTLCAKGVVVRILSKIGAGWGVTSEIPNLFTILMRARR
jgi:hypothetical protein